MRKGVMILIVTVSVLAALVAGAGTWAWQELNAPIVVSTDGEHFDVRAGAPLSAITAELGSRGIIASPRLLEWFGRLTGDATRIHAGEYALSSDLTALSLLEKLKRGDVFLHQFTIIEGWRFEDLLRQIRAHPAVKVGTDSPADIMTALGRPDEHPEGQFLPDTYVFARGTPDLEILGWAHEALWAELDAAWAGRAPNISLANAYEALILASIVEKETALTSERKMISGVFHARLQRRMRLQTDPTVIYGLGDAYDGNLRRRDLDRDTPYNTYTRGGLPPTPIALPGRDSILAATNPEQSDALYFVATGEPDGSHKFSATLEEHNRAVQDYLQRLRRSQ